VPLSALPPDHAPDAAQVVMPAVVQVSSEAPPASTLLGLAPSVTIGAGAVTVTVADWVAEPPVPVQVSS
jgi:hypothetical protein